MAVVTRKVSDITGTEGAEADFATLVIRVHPKSDQPKRIDVLPPEVDGLKEIADLVILELRQTDGTTKELYVRYPDFVKIVTDEVVEKAPGTRGRIPGSRVGNGNGGY